MNTKIRNSGPMMRLRGALRKMLLTGVGLVVLLTVGTPNNDTQEA